MVVKLSWKVASKQSQLKDFFGRRQLQRAGGHACLRAAHAPGPCDCRRRRDRPSVHPNAGKLILKLLPPAFSKVDAYGWWGPASAHNGRWGKHTICFSLAAVAIPALFPTLPRLRGKPPHRVGSTSLLAAANGQRHDPLAASARGIFGHRRQARGIALNG